MRRWARRVCAVLVPLGAVALAPARVLAVSPAGFAESTVSELLEQAIFTEETVGDLDAAIVLYREIIAQAEANKTFVARARYRLGLCHLKKGDKEEAATVLRGLVADSPRQKDLVARARAQLAELGHPAVGPGVVLRQVWDNADDYLGAPSPDGRLLTFTDWSTGDLALRDLETGLNRSLTAKGSWATPSFAEHSIFSPNGKKVAYAWFGGETGYELRVIGVDGSGARRVHDGKDTQWIQPLDWTPDGGQILVWLNRADGSDQIALVSVDDGTTMTVGTLPGYEPGRTDLSPDGRHVVYSRVQADGTRQRDVFALSLESGRHRPLVEHPADDIALGWSPDGRQVFFASDRTGEWSAWAVAVDDPGPSASARLLKAALGDVLGQIKPMGFARTGSYFYGLAASQKDVYVDALDPRTGEPAGSPRKITRRFEGSNSMPGWARDGTRLAWISKREGVYYLIVRDSETGDEREVPVSPSIDRIHRHQNLRWSPDGRSVIVAAAAASGGSYWGVFRLDTATGEATRLANAGPGSILFNPMWSPDGETLYFERGSPDGATIVALDLRTGEERIVVEEPAGTMALSPDGRWIAFNTDLYDPREQDRTPALKVVSVAGGDPRVVFRSNADAPFEGRSPLAWTPDGRHLLFGASTPPASKQPDARIQLWKVPVEAGAREKVGLAMPNLTQLQVDPDGRRIVFVAGERKTEVWAMENFLPEPRAEP